MRKITLASVLATSIFCLAACSSTSGVNPTSDGGTDAPPDAPLGCERGAVWGASAAKIKISSFGFFDGSMGYEKSREELTPAQNDALANLCVIAPPTVLGNDYVSYRITITDKSGVETKYRAAQDNVLDGDEGPIKAPTLDYHTLRPFLDTIHCVSAGDTRVGPQSEIDAGSDGGPDQPWSKAPTMNDDPGCSNGVFAPYTCADIWLKLAIAQAGDYELTTSSCREKLRIRVYSPDGATEIATSNEGTAPACPSTPATFAQAGTYIVKLEKRNVAGCTEESGAGDFALRISHVTH